MKLTTATLNTIPLLSLLTILASCSGQRTGPVAGGTPTFRHPTIAKGQAVSEIDQAIWINFQAKNNDHWFGSDGRGVYRYDGKTITRFTTKDGLPGDRIRELKEDKSGNIYIGTLEGIGRFDGRTFTTLAPTVSDEWRLEPDDLWFQGNSIGAGPLRYDGKSLYALKFPRHEIEDGYRAKFPVTPGSPYGVYTIYKDSRGDVWFGTACFGACRYDGRSFTWVSEDEMTELDDGPAFGVRGIIEDRDGMYWLSNTLYRYEVHPAGSAARGNTYPECKKEKSIGASSAADKAGYSYFMSGVKDDHGDLWFATYGAGVWRYDGRRLSHYPVVDGDKPVTIFSIYKDNQGVLWLGTHEAGARKFNGRTFEKFRL